MRTCTNQSISRFSITAAVLLVLVLCSEQPEYVSVLFTGDVMLDRGVRNAVAWKEPDILFNHVRDIFAENDFVFINLECPLTTVVNPAEKEYVFRGDPSWIPALTRAGVTHASLGNNHILDQGGIGAQETVDSLRAHDIEPVWIRGDFLEPAVIRRNGVIVGVYSVNLLPDTLSGVSFDMLIDSIRQFRKDNPQSIIVVYPHWGWEYIEEPHKGQIENARRLIDAGANAIIGHHPHVVQTVEEYNEGIIFYSLGNFIFDQYYPGTDKGLAVQLVFGKGKIEQINLFPIIIESAVPRLASTDEWSSVLNLKSMAIKLPEYSAPIRINYR